MSESLNEVDRGEPDQLASPSRITLDISVSHKTTPCASALADRDRREELRPQLKSDSSFFW